MLPAIYVIALEAVVCGLMINRTLFSKSRHMWHLPIYIFIKTALCSLATYLKLSMLVTPLCILISFIYAFVYFGDSLKRKLTVTLAGCCCLGLSNLFKFSILGYYDLTQQYNLSRDVLASVSCIAASMILFCALTITATNIICRVKPHIILVITSASMIVLLLCGAVYSYMHYIIEVQFNGIFSVYALLFMLPAIILLYFTESVIFSGQENFLKK